MKGTTPVASDHGHASASVSGSVLRVSAEKLSCDMS